MNFPNTPALNQTYSYGGRTWKWNGDGWQLEVTNPLAGYAGANTITTLGTISTGVWNGSVISVPFGGTGLSSYTPGNFLYASGATTLGQRTPAQVLQDIGALAASSYTAADVLSKLLTVDGAGSGIDADLLDGQQGSYYLAASAYTASDVRTKLLTVDGAGSGIDADLLDGLNSVDFPRRDGTLLYSLGTTGVGTTNVWHEVFKWTVTAQYHGFNAKLELIRRGNIDARAAVHIHGEYGASAWNQYPTALSISGDYLSSEDKFMLVFDDTAKTATLYYARNGEWNNTYAAIVYNHCNSATFAYTNTSLGSTTDPTGNYVVSANSTTNFYKFFTIYNDGAASGLDSDLLDGQHGTYYVDLANATGTLNVARLPAFTGDVTSPAGSSVNTIAAGAVTLAKMANLAANSILGNNTGAAATPLALTAAQVRTMLNVADGATANTGTVTSVSVVTANGVSGSVATSTTTPAITLTLGAITPTSVAATGTVTGSNLSGTNTGDQTTITGNAGTATALQTARTVAISGAATGTATSFDGSANISIPITAIDLTHVGMSGVLGADHLGSGVRDGTKFLRDDGTWQVVAGGGSVTSVSVVTANGVSGTVATNTTTPAITLTLGAITPTTVTASGAISAVGGTISGTGNLLVTADNGIRVRSSGLTTGLDIGAAPTLAGSTDPDVYLYNRSNGAIWWGTNNALRGKMLANGTFEWNSHIQVTGTGRVYSPAHFNANSATAVLASNASGQVLLRPHGHDVSTYQLAVDTTGVSWNGNSIWHTGNDNAMMKYRGTVTTANLNTATGTGFYIVDDTTATYSMLTWNTASSTGPVQLHLHFGGELKFRNQVDSTNWSVWRKLWHDGNDGAGSGLDADLLDGMNASAAAGGSTIVARNPSGYVYANYFNCTADVTATSPSHVAVFTGSDNFIRQQTLAQFRINSSALSTPAGDQSRDEGVAKWMRWKNFGNGHIIFDASNSTSPTGSAVNNTNPDSPWIASYPTLMGWNGTNTYGVRVYIANVADSTSGAGIVIGSRIWAGADAGIAGAISTNSWFRSIGGTGWYNQTYGGGINMEDSTYIRVYGGKTFMVAGPGGSTGDLRLESVSPTITCYDTDNATSHWIHCNSNQHGFLANNAFSWAAYRDPSNNWGCVGNITAYASDRRLKTNIKTVPMSRVNDVFDRIVIREYDWDAEAIARHKIGFAVTLNQVGAIAQEVQEVFPDAVVVNGAHNPIPTAENPNPEKPDFLTIQWEKFIPLLIAKVQEQEARIKQLEQALS